MANSTIEVTWMPDESTLKITGKIRYDDSTQWASDSQITEYSIRIELLGPKNDVMIPRVSGIKRDGWTADGSDPESDYHSNENSMPTSFDVRNLTSEITSEDTTKPELMGRLRYCVSSAISKLCNNISWRFAHAGKFVYPGYGGLDFKSPKFTKSGNIVAEVDFKHVLPIS
ncbi:uncharacterized protein ColTof4_14469 [Colletotrichum tofieldiae]|nr:uncharacterized protein ColTof4_14469 [Colletotrichum tofieldiae]